MSKGIGASVVFNPLDDLFESTVPEKQEQTSPTTLKLDGLTPFKEHPFKLYGADKMAEMVESVATYGVFNPIIVRPIENGFEIIAGHNRVEACRLAGLTEIPAIIKEVDDDTATIMMIDSNLKQRETILPSEKAKAYKMKLEAIKRQGERTDLTSYQVGMKLKGKQSNQIIAEQHGESGVQISRFVRLNELIPEMLDMVDERRMAFNPAVELSYLTPELQTELLDVIEANEVTPSLSQAQRLKTAAQSGKLDRNSIEIVMSEEKPQQNNITIKSSVMDKYIPKDYTPKQKEEFILKALEVYCRRLERLKNERQQER